MPTYVYRVIKADRAENPDADETLYEFRQSMREAALTHHPETGEPIERVVCAPNIAVGKLGNAALNSAGFTKYSKRSDGTYEKQAGAGPKHVDPQKFKHMLGD